jgi:hypothetical protein
MIRKASSRFLCLYDYAAFFTSRGSFARGLMKKTALGSVPLIASTDTITAVMIPAIATDPSTIELIT